MGTWTLWASVPQARPQQPYDFEQPSQNLCASLSDLGVLRVHHFGVSWGLGSIGSPSDMLFGYHQSSSAFNGRYPGTQALALKRTVRAKPPRLFEAGSSVVPFWVT